MWVGAAFIESRILVNTLCNKLRHLCHVPEQKIYSVRVMRKVGMGLCSLTGRIETLYSPLVGGYRYMRGAEGQMKARKYPLEWR